MNILRKLMPFLVGFDILEVNGFVAPNRFRKYLCDFTSVMGYVVLVTATIMASGFLAFEAETYEEISEHFYEFATVLNETFYLIFIHCKCRQFFELTDNYEQIVKKRSINDEKQKIYEKANRFIEVWSNYIYVGYVKIVLPFTTFPYLFMSYFNYLTTDLRENAFTLPYVMWTIFDWRTPTTYIFAFAFQFLVSAYVVVVGAVLLLHVFATILLFVAFIDDIKADMRALDAHKKTKISDGKFYEHLCDIIKFHTEIKHVFAQFGEAYGLLFIMDLLWTASTMAVVLVSLQMELTRPEIDLPAILKDISVTFATLVVFLVLCSVCEELKGQYEDLNIYLRCNWYQYPDKMKRILPLIILQSQNMDVFKIFGSITASRETSKKVINGGFQTIMLLHTILK